MIYSILIVKIHKMDHNDLQYSDVLHYINHKLPQLSVLSYIAWCFNTLFISPTVFSS